MPRTQRPRRTRTSTRTRVKRTRTASRNGASRNGAGNGAAHTAADNQAEVLEVLRNRRYIAFVRAIVGAARLRNSSR